MTQEQTGDTTSQTGPGTRRPRTVRGHALRWVFRMVMAALILLLAMRTYEETGVAHARSNGSLQMAEATITKLTSHTTRGSNGGGQDGSNGVWIVTTKHTIELRVGDETKTVDGVPDDSAKGLEEGQRVAAGLWHGRVVEIDGRTMWLGWHPGGWDIPLVVLYPLIMGYLIALTLNVVAFLAGLGGRVRLERQQRLGPAGFGFLVGMAAILVLIVCAVFGKGIAYWPSVPIGAGTVAALVGLRGALRRASPLP
ncbi:hypothetical protein [Streptomyces sp. H39-S7]|uniref:hypothetical protein n=1 Tax=Streptomyces sp. H39-S7 TaxID=3004357 RepID=UPI0022AFD755|nr:hypothetical protein [Streptomyces sp. H39-S7]MCZ4122816.1 hypothetical protein [Streptomyces sp. H39-S7]